MALLAPPLLRMHVQCLNLESALQDKLLAAAPAGADRTSMPSALSQLPEDEVLDLFAAPEPTVPIYRATLNFESLELDLLNEDLANEGAHARLAALHASHMFILYSSTGPGHMDVQVRPQGSDTVQLRP